MLIPQARTGWFFLIFLFTSAALAQQKAPVSSAPAQISASACTDAEHTGANEFNFWAGYSPDSIKKIGVSENRRLFMAGAGYARVLLAGRSVAWKFTSEVVPVALVSQPTFAGTEIAQPSHLPSSFPSGLFGRRTTYGVGVTPIGFQFNFRRQKRIQPILGIDGGLLYFPARQVPIAGSANFNFTFSLRTGVQIFTSDSRALTAGYRFHHISNADTGNPFNPGIDSNFFYIAYSFFR